MAPAIGHIPAMVLMLAVQAVGAIGLRLDVCYNFGCNDKASVELAENDLELIRRMFHHPASAEDERASIRQAIAWMEQIVGRKLPTANDVARNYQKGMAESGQMDCIDESINTTGYLLFLQRHGLLHWHEVVERAFRAPFLFDQHWSAQIRERRSGRRYVVDSWFGANGEPPLIQPLEDWQRKRPPSK